jgi:hypothetical protein
MTHKIRIYTARVETRYGTSVASIVDDPESSMCIFDIEDKLMEKLNYTVNEDVDACYPGNCDGEGAYFDYDGYVDLEIPESIVNRILKGE